MRSFLLREKGQTSPFLFFHKKGGTSQVESGEIPRNSGNSPENTSPLKNDGWKTILSLWNSPLAADICRSFFMFVLGMWLGDSLVNLVKLTQDTCEPHQLNLGKKTPFNWKDGTWPTKPNSIPSEKEKNRATQQREKQRPPSDVGLKDKTRVVHHRSPKSPEKRHHHRESHCSMVV